MADIIEGMKVKRMKYFDGLFLTQEEFNLEQNYHIRMRRLHNRHLHSYGIVWGLDVIPDGTNSIMVREGMVLNRSRGIKDEGNEDEEISQEIVLTRDTPHILESDEIRNGVYIYLDFEKVGNYVVEEKGATEQIHWLEDAVIGHTTDINFVKEYEGKVILAKILNENGIISNESILYFDDNIPLRTYAGAYGNLTLPVEKESSDEPDTSAKPTIDGKKIKDQNGILVESPETEFNGNVEIMKNLTVTGIVDGNLAVNIVGRDQIQDNAVISSKIADKNIITAKLADGAVISEKIGNTAVLREHLNSDIFANFLTSPDKTLGISADIPNKVIKLTSQVATGIVEFSGFTQSVQNVSGFVDPGFGPGVTSVILSLDESNTSNNQVFMGDPEAAGFFDLPDVSLGALVDTLTGKFKVGMRVNGVATAPIRVRWWAFKPGADRDPMIVVSVSIKPLNSGLRPGGIQQFEAKVTGTDNGLVEWRVEEIDGGSITNEGLYTAPATPGIYHVIATSLEDPSKSGMASVEVTEDIFVTISPSTASIFAGEQLQFTATVTGSANPRVTWSVVGPEGGTIDSEGLFTASEGNYTVIATSKADPSKTATAQIEVKPVVAVTINPTEVNIFTGRQMQFKATVTGSADTGVLWSVQEGTAGGTISGTGLYTAPSGINLVRDPSMPPVISPGVVGTYHVVAKSKADPTKTAVALVTVTQITISISPVTVTMLPGKTQKFVATVLGIPDNSVDWSIQEGAAGGTIDSTGLYKAPSGIVLASESLPISRIESTGPPIIKPTEPAPIVPGPKSVSPGTVPVSPGTIIVSPGTIPITPGPIPISPGTVPIRPPITPPSGAIGVYHVIAKSRVDPTKMAIATVTVTLVSVSISPGNISLLPGGVQQFSPTVSNIDNNAVTIGITEGIEGGTLTWQWTQIAVKKAMAVGESWDLGEGWVLIANSIDAKSTPRQVWLSLLRNGTKVDDQVIVQGQTYQYYSIFAAKIDSIFAGIETDMVQLTGVLTNPTNKVLYTAPPAPGTYHVVATSVADSTKTATATVTVTPAISVSVNPASSAVNVNKGLQFGATVTGTTNTAVTWSVQEIGGGSINPNGLYIAPGTPGTYHVIATSVADATKTATATVTVKPALSVSINPVSFVLHVNQALQFDTVIANNLTTLGIAFSVQEIGGGSISATGLYIAPGTPGTYHVIATSIEDSTKVAIATVTVKPVLSVSINPVSATIGINQTVKFTGALTGNITTAGATWKVQETGGGSITAGLYTAPETPGTYHVILTSDEDNTKFAIATVTVIPPISVTINPASAAIEVGDVIQFTPKVTGTANIDVTWKVQETIGGSISKTGLYIAPSIPGTYHVIATSVVDTTKTATATITVTRIVKTGDKTALTDKTGDKTALADKTGDKTALAEKMGDKVASEKIVLERSIEVIPAKDPGSVSTDEGGTILDGSSKGRAFIRKKERPDIGKIKKAKK